MNELIKLAAMKDLKPFEEETATLETSVKNILNVIVGLLGLVAVIVIILGGISYMTSAGDPQKVKKAKDTILYGIIGLIICALAFVIVNFFIGAIASSGQA